MREGVSGDPAASAEFLRRPTPWVREVTRDAVRHFAWGIGDDNPLWLDAEYAARSRWGGIIAPPCFAYAADETTVAPGLADRRRVYSWVEWRWRDVFRLGVQLSVSVRPDGSEPAPGAGREPALLQTGRVEFADAKGSVLASARTGCLRPAPVPLSPEQGELARPYTDEELETIERAILAESRRGRELRHWEDTEVGEELGPLVKGPLSIMDIVAWCAATQGLPDAEDEASEGGLRCERATGPQRASWASHLISDWIGDDGFLARLRVQLLSEVPLGAVSWWRGRVTDRRMEAGVPLVELTLQCTDQRHEATGSGSAIVLLPSRDHGPVLLPAWGDA